MDNVEPFPASGGRVFVCGCDCATFFLHDDGIPRCTSCGEAPDDYPGGWHERAIGAGAHEGPYFSDTEGADVADFARRHMERKVTEDDVAVIMLARDDGSTCLWSGIEAPEQMAWLRRRFADAMRLAQRGVCNA